jgi:hypothetical protein
MRQSSQAFQAAAAVVSDVKQFQGGPQRSNSMSYGFVSRVAALLTVNEFRPWQTFHLSEVGK